MGRIIAIDRDGARKELDVKPGDSLMFPLRDAMLVEASCGGCASCGTCHITVEPEWMAKLPPRKSDETDMLESLSHFDEAKSRLSCQVNFSEEMDGLVLQVAPPE